METKGLGDATAQRERGVVALVASAGFLGYSPVAPGTVGSLAGIPFFFAFDWLARESAPAVCVAYLGFVLFACWIAGRAEKVFQEHDSGRIVIDEVVGYVAATLFLEPSLATVAGAFLFFRVLDIVKPFPAGYIDRRFPGGYGVVLDDVVSGFYANALLRLALHFL